MWWRCEDCTLMEAGVSTWERRATKCIAEKERAMGVPIRLAAWRVSAFDASLFGLSIAEFSR